MITITGMNLTGGDSCDVVYGDFPGRSLGSGDEPRRSALLGGHEGNDGAPHTFQPIATSPEVWVASTDGSGSMVADTPTVPNGSSGNTINFTYTAAFGGRFGGAVTLTVPPGWSPPDDSDPTQPGFTTATIPGGCGCPPIVFVDGRTIFVFPLFLGIPGDPETDLDITYGDKTGGSGHRRDRAHDRREAALGDEGASGCGCDSTLRKLSSAPLIRVLSPDGSGTMNASASTVSANYPQHDQVQVRSRAGRYG